MKKVNFKLEQPMKAQRGVRDTASPFLKLSTRWRLVINVTTMPLYPR
jgi:hypothetical protein